MRLWEAWLVGWVVQLVAPPRSGDIQGSVLGADAARTAVDQTVLAAEKSANFLDPKNREWDTVARRVDMEDTAALPPGIFGEEQDTPPFLIQLHEMSTAAAANAAHNVAQQPASLSPSGLQAIANKTRTALDDMFQNGRRVNSFFGNLLNMNSTLAEFDKETARLGFSAATHIVPPNSLRNWLGIAAIVAIAVTIVLCVVPYLFSFTRDLKKSSVFYHGNAGASDDTSPTGSASRASDLEASSPKQGSRQQGKQQQSSTGNGETGSGASPTNQRNNSDEQCHISATSDSQLKQQVPPSMPTPPGSEDTKNFLKGSKKNKGKGKKKDIDGGSTYSSPVQNGSCEGSASPTQNGEFGDFLTAASASAGLSVKVKDHYYIGTEPRKDSNNLDWD